MASLYDTVFADVMADEPDEEPADIAYDRSRDLGVDGASPHAVHPDAEEQS